MYLSRACFQSGTWYRKVCVMWKWKANRKLAIFSPCFPGKPPKIFSRLWITLIYKANIWILPLFWTTLFELDKLKLLCLLWFASAVIKIIKELACHAITSSWFYLSPINTSYFIYPRIFRVALTANVSEHFNNTTAQWAKIRLQHREPTTFLWSRITQNRQKKWMWLKWDVREFQPCIISI